MTEEIFSLENDEKYKDIITKTVYPLNRFKNNQLNRPVVFHPETTISRIKNPKVKNRLLTQGYLTKKDAIEIYCLINDIEDKFNIIEIKELTLEELQTITKNRI